MPSPLQLAAESTNDREHRRETCATCSGTGCSPGSWDGPRQVICEACGGSGAVEVSE